MYTYAFLKRPDYPLTLPEGIHSAVELISGSHLSAIVEPGAFWEELQANDEQLVQAVLSHDRVIREVFLQTTVLPLRFGTRFASAESLVAHLESSTVNYLDKLAQFTGKAEYTLKLIPFNSLTETVIPVGAQGKDYFLAKKLRYQVQSDHQQQQAAELQNLVQAIAQYYPDAIFSESQDGTQRIYLLASCQEESYLAESLRKWQNQYSRWQISLGEPLAPYHFV